MMAWPRKLPIKLHISALSTETRLYCDSPSFAFGAALFSFSITETCRFFIRSPWIKARHRISCSSTLRRKQYKPPPFYYMATFCERLKGSNTEMKIRDKQRLIQRMYPEFILFLINKTEFFRSYLVAKCRLGSLVSVSAETSITFHETNRR